MSPMECPNCMITIPTNPNLRGGSTSLYPTICPTCGEKARPSSEDRKISYNDNPYLIYGTTAIIGVIACWLFGSWLINYYQDEDERIISSQQPVNVGQIFFGGEVKFAVMQPAASLIVRGIKGAHSSVSAVKTKKMVKEKQFYYYEGTNEGDQIKVRLETINLSKGKFQENILLNSYEKKAILKTPRGEGIETSATRLLELRILPSKELIVQEIRKR